MIDSTQNPQSPETPTDRELSSLADLIPETQPEYEPPYPNPAHQIDSQQEVADRFRQMDAEQSIREKLESNRQQYGRTDYPQDRTQEIER